MVHRGSDLDDDLYVMSVLAAWFIVVQILMTICRSVCDVCIGSMVHRGSDLDDDLYVMSVLAAWFIVVQILMTTCILLEFINVIVVILIWVRTSKTDKSGHGERRASFRRVQTTMIIAISTSEFHSLFNQINQLQFLDQGSVPAETTEYFHE